MTDEYVEQVCLEATTLTNKEVVAANYTVHSQLVPSLYRSSEKAVEIVTKKETRMEKILPVSGAFIQVDATSS